MDQKVKELAEYRIHKAKQNLEIVESLIRDGYYKFCHRTDPTMQRLMPCVLSTQLMVSIAASIPV